MGHPVVAGVFLVMVAGLMSGTCMLPSKFVRAWKWENVWLVFSMVSLVIIPWILAFVFVDHLVETYRALTFQQLAIPILLGAGWGIAQILFGVSVKRLGLGIAYAIPNPRRFTETPKRICAIPHPAPSNIGMASC